MISCHILSFNNLSSLPCIHSRYLLVLCFSLPHHSLYFTYPNGRRWKTRWRGHEAFDGWVVDSCSSVPAVPKYSLHLRPFLQLDHGLALTHSPSEGRASIVNVVVMCDLWRLQLRPFYSGPVLLIHSGRWHRRCSSWGSFCSYACGRGAISSAWL